MKPVALGVIGCGVIGRVHLGIAAQSPLVEVVAVADLIPERVEAAAKEHGIATTYAQGSELLDDPAIEAVILALPTNVRGALALKAFAKGLHALIEKPIAMDATEAEKLINVSRDGQMVIRDQQHEHARDDTSGDRGATWSRCADARGRGSWNRRGRRRSLSRQGRWERYGWCGAGRSARPGRRRRPRRRSGG